MRKILSIVCGLLALASTGTSQGSDGCTYPVTHMIWTSKIAGDYLTIADVNQLRHCVELLQQGPLRPTDGSVSAPSFSWRDDPNTGLYRSGANEFVAVTDGVQRAKWSNTGLLVGTTGTARGNFTSTKNGTSLVHNSITLDPNQSTNLEHATNGVGASDGILLVFAASGSGKACQFVVGGGSNTSTVLSGTSGTCEITDTGTDTIALYPDGDGTYTLKSRLSSTLPFNLFWIGL